MAYLLQQSSSLLPRFELYLEIFTKWSVLKLTSQPLLPIRYGGYCPWGECPFPLCLNPFRTLLNTLQERFHYTLLLANARCSGVGFCWFKTSSKDYNDWNCNFWEANTAMNHRTAQPLGEKINRFFCDAFVVNLSLDVLLWNPNLILQI